MRTADQQPSSGPTPRPCLISVPDGADLDAAHPARRAAPEPWTQESAGPQRTAAGAPLNSAPDARAPTLETDERPPGRFQTFLVSSLLLAGTIVTSTALLLVVLRLWSARRPSWATVAACGAVAIGLVIVMTIGWRRNGLEADDRHGNHVVPPLLATDPLTGALNRDGLVADLEGAAHGDDRNGLALLFVDLDRFDLINGRLGRAIGDETLRALASRLDDANPGDTPIARISGSTFVAVRHESTGADDWADRLARLVTEPVTVSGITLHLACAAVLVTTDGFHHDAATLLDDAEFAARGRIVDGRARVEHIHLAIGVDEREATGVVAQVQQAVVSGGITADYQPVIDLRNMQPVGVEALARWRGAAPGFEAPDDFLEVVTALGMMPEVFDTILRSVCRDFASGPAADRGWWVSVNLAKEDCIDQTLPSRVSRILAETGLDPSRLVLEVSERAIPDPAVERALRNLAQLGIRLAIDDFGSGWSSLAQLRSLPISLIKIDRSLVANPSTADAHLTMSTIALAGALGIEALAEGVESGEDLLLLCLAECHYGQGFWWSEADSLDAILAKFPVRADDEIDDPYAPVFDMGALIVANAQACSGDGTNDDIEAVLESALWESTDNSDDQLIEFLEASLALSVEPAGDAPGHTDPATGRDSAEPAAEIDAAAPDPSDDGDATGSDSVGPDALELGDVDESAWLDISNDDFLAKLRSIRSAPTDPQI